MSYGFGNGLTWNFLTINEVTKIEKPEYCIFEVDEHDENERSDIELYFYWFSRRILSRVENMLQHLSKIRVYVIILSNLLKSLAKFEKDHEDYHVKNDEYSFLGRKIIRQ